MGSQQNVKGKELKSLVIIIIDFIFASKNFLANFIFYFLDIQTAGSAAYFWREQFIHKAAYIAKF